MVKIFLGCERKKYVCRSSKKVHFKESDDSGVQKSTNHKKASQSKTDE